MNLKPILIQLGVVLGIPALIVGTYWFFLRSPEVEQVATPTTELIEKAAKVREALAIIDRLRFDDSLFSMPAFDTLIDQTVPIQDEAVGRENPFVIPEELRPKQVTPTPPPNPPAKSATTPKSVR